MVDLEYPGKNDDAFDQNSSIGELNVLWRFLGHREWKGPDVEGEKSQQ